MNELIKKKKNAWDTYDESRIKEVFSLSDRYKEFMSKCKTERECVEELVSLAEVNGFFNIKDVISKGEKLKPGDKVYSVNKGKGLIMFVIGSDSFENGLRILGSHIDSPRLDLKQNPLYEEDELAFLETHYYGGIKKYQWVALPLSIHGVIVKKDGTTIKVIIGEDENDPVIGISDLLPHLSQDQMEKKGSIVIEGEDLNILVGSKPINNKEIKDRVKYSILMYLKDKYDIVEEDFISAELEVVPAGRARDYGLDKSMIMAYGHDDRICAYTSFEAIINSEPRKFTKVAIFVDKEEVGSIGATGMESKFFENTVAEIMELVGDYSELKLRRALANSKMLSSDVCAAYDPNYPSVMEKKNAAFFGRGVVFIKYTGRGGKAGCNDANAEFVAEIREIMDRNGVVCQTSELGKVDQGGGGTIALIPAKYGMEVIDCGICLQNMHAPWEVASKADIYEATKGYKAFLEG